MLGFSRLRRFIGSRDAFDQQSSSIKSSLPENEQQLHYYAEKARDCGIDRLVLYLSFDCDTDEDAAAALELDPWLRERGIEAEYAVPGAQFERSADTYRQIRDRGARFLNHGGRSHTQWQNGRYVPMTFYDQLPAKEVVADIHKGHEIVESVLGYAPKGFRAPHFGCFQRTDQLRIIYDTTRSLGYTYCSTTIPVVALQHGPLVDRQGIIEIPLFGSLHAPTTILDSWTYLEDRVNYRLGNQYFELLRDTVSYMVKHDLPGVLSYYVDPAHVRGQKPFLEAMELFAGYGIPSIGAEDLISCSNILRATR